MNILYDKLNQSDWNVFTRILILNLYYVWKEQKDEFLFLVLASNLRLFRSIEKFGILLPNSKLIIKYFFNVDFVWNNNTHKQVLRQNTHEANFRRFGDVSRPSTHLKTPKNHEEGGRKRKRRSFFTLAPGVSIKPKLLSARARTKTFNVKEDVIVHAQMTFPRAWKQALQLMAQKDFSSTLLRRFWLSPLQRVFPALELL